MSVFVHKCISKVQSLKGERQSPSAHPFAGESSEYWEDTSVYLNSEQQTPTPGYCDRAGSVTCTGWLLREGQDLHA